MKLKQSWNIGFYSLQNFNFVFTKPKSNLNFCQLRTPKFTVIFGIYMNWRSPKARFAHAYWIWWKLLLVVGFNILNTIFDFKYLQNYIENDINFYWLATICSCTQFYEFKKLNIKKLKLKKLKFLHSTDFVESGPTFL